jgi:hypothetical protein
MKMCSSGFAPRRRQGGFIQGAILFALVIIAVVVAAFSLANRDSQSSADTEQARVNASFVLKVGNDLQTGVNRAIADGLSPDKLTSSGVVFDQNASTATALNLFDVNLKYVVRPQFPPTALNAADTAQPFAGSDGAGTGATAAWAAKAVTGAGGTNREAIITVPGLKPDVCKRINVTANGTLVTADLPADLAGTPATWREGCFGTNSSAGTYFRVVATDALAPAAGGGGGGGGGGGTP